MMDRQLCMVIGVVFLVLIQLCVSTNYNNTITPYQFNQTNILSSNQTLPNNLTEELSLMVINLTQINGNKTSLSSKDNITSHLRVDVNNSIAILLTNGSLTNVTARTTSKPSITIIRRRTIKISLGGNLQDFCVQVKIPKENCQCPKLGSVCRYFDTEQAVNVKVLVCSKVHKIRTNIIIGVSSIGIFGNLLCLLVTVMNDKNTICRKIIGMLAFADLVFSSLQFVVTVPGFWTCEWIYNPITCKFLYSMINSTGIMALGFILIISLERFNGIVKPFLDTSSNKKVFLMTLLNISLALIFVVPTILVSKIKDLGHGSLCKEDWPFKSYSLAYSWFLLMVTFVIPITIISYLYLRIVKSLKDSQNHTQRTFSNKDLSRRKKEDIRITIIIAYLLISFTILVSPNRILWVLLDHNVFNKFSTDTLAFINLGASVPYTIHACVNPIIYSVIDKRFRKSLSLFFYKLTCQRKAAIHIKEKFKSSFNLSTDTNTSSVNNGYSNSSIRSSSYELQVPPPSNN